VWSTTSILKHLSTRSLFRWPTCTLGANDRLAEEEVRRAAAAVAEEEEAVFSHELSPFVLTSSKSSHANIICI